MKKGMILFVAAVISVVLTACGSNENRGESATQAEYGVSEGDAELSAHENVGEGVVSEIYEYETDIIRYGELAGAFSFQKDVERTQTDCAVYYFELSISEQERQACIEVTDRVLSCIDGTLPELEIAVFTNRTFDGIAVSDNRFYTSIQPWDSAEYLAGVLLAGYSEWGSYGMAYGYANYLCREAGLEYQEADSLIPMNDPGPYDLNLLCFDEKFVSQEDVEAAKNNACLFVDDYLSAHSDTEFLGLLSESGTTEGMRKANEALETFYAKNGVECGLTNICYQYGGVTFDYAARCEYACFYLGTDWQDRSWETNPRVSENFLHEDYGEVRAFFECNVRQMRQYQELFGFDNYNNDLLVCFTNGKSTSSPSFYLAESHTVYLVSVVSLMHEYIHSLMEVHYVRQSRWNTDGFARYYDCLYNDYAYDFWNYDYNNTGGDYDSQKVGSYLSTYIEHIGRPIDVRTDNLDLMDFMTCAYGWADPDLTYGSGASFFGYLIKRYGEEAAIQYACSFYEYNAQWGKSYEELVQDWNAYINENYSWYRTENLL